MSNLTATVRPSALLSAASCVLQGGNPLTVSDIPFDHPMLPAAVRDLAAATGEPVPAMYADRDTIADLIGADPREADISAADAAEHHEWAREHGLADDEIAYGDLDPDTTLDPEADEHPSDYADGDDDRGSNDDAAHDEYDPRDVADLSEQGEPVEGAYPSDWDDGSLDSLAGPE